MPDISEYIVKYDAQKCLIESQSRFLLDCYKKLTGHHLIEIEETASPTQIAQAVFFAPFAILSGGNESDQILNYANLKALQLWEMEWTEITRIPSRLTAEPLHRDERARFLEKVRVEGYISDYQGIRISKNKRRFRIEEATVWNLVCPDDGEFLGQAATFSRYTYL